MTIQVTSCSAECSQRQGSSVTTFRFELSIWVQELHRLGTLPLHSLYSTIGSPSSCRVPMSPEHRVQPVQHRIDPLQSATPVPQSLPSPASSRRQTPSRPGGRLKLMVMDHGSRPGEVGRSGRGATAQKDWQHVAGQQTRVHRQTRGARLYGQGRARTGLLGSRAGPKPCREPLPTGQCRAWCEYELIIFCGPEQRRVTGPDATSDNSDLAVCGRVAVGEPGPGTLLGSESWAAAAQVPGCGPGPDRPGWQRRGAVAAREPGSNSRRASAQRRQPAQVAATPSGCGEAPRLQRPARSTIPSLAASACPPSSAQGMMLPRQSTSSSIAGRERLQRRVTAGVSYSRASARHITSIRGRRAQAPEKGAGLRTAMVVRQVPP